jgi:predicted component of type VI protein secretion system
MARIFLTFNNKILSSHLIVAGQKMTVGRDAENTICIDHPAVSLKHAKILYDEQGLHLSDLGSTNGTMVNDERVLSCQLAHQDWVLIGKHLLVVDLYETLSLEAAAQMLKGDSSGVLDAQGTMMLNIDHIDQGLGQHHVQRFDFLSFISEKKEDFELSNRPVYIGKNKDADILVKGLWTFLSGEPSARIERHGGDYYLEFVSGMLRPKVNNKPVEKPTKLFNQDVIKIGALRMQVHRTFLDLSPQL